MTGGPINQKVIKKQNIIFYLVIKQKPEERNPPPPLQTEIRFKYLTTYASCKSSINVHHNFKINDQLQASHIDIFIFNHYFKNSTCSETAFTIVIFQTCIYDMT